MAAPSSAAQTSKPQKRPAQASQDALHPPKKQRLERVQKDAKDVAKVAGAGGGARPANGKGKEKARGSVNPVLNRGNKPTQGLIPTAPDAAEGPKEPTTTVPKSTESGKVAEGGAGAGNGTKGAGSVQKESPAKTTKTNEKKPSGPTKQPLVKATTKNSKVTSDSATTNGKHLHTARRMQPMKPLTKDNQSALHRPKNASPSGPTRDIGGRDVVFVTRKTRLGSYMRRCKTLLVDDGLNQITLHALCVAIPHAVMLLYAVIDILPFPRQFIHHEIQTSTVECNDEMSVVAGLEAAALGKDKGKGKAGAGAIFEEDEGGIRSRMKSGIRITIRIGKGARVPAEHGPAGATTSGKARPNKVQRVARRAGDDEIVDAGDGGMVETLEEEEEEEEEEEGMNDESVPVPTATLDQPSMALKETSKRQHSKAGNQLSSGQKKQKQKGKGGKQTAGKSESGAVAMDVD